MIAYKICTESVIEMLSKQQKSELNELIYKVDVYTDRDLRVILSKIIDALPEVSELSENVQTKEIKRNYIQHTCYNCVHQLTHIFDSSLCDYEKKCFRAKNNEDHYLKLKSGD